MTSLDKILNLPPKNFLLPNSPNLLKAPQPHRWNSRRAANFQQKQSRSFEFSVEMGSKMEAGEEGAKMKRSNTIGKLEGGAKQRGNGPNGGPAAEEKECGKHANNGDGAKRNDEEGKEQENEAEEEFWTGISALRNTKYGIGMWCIAWNGVGLFLLKEKSHFLLNLFLGFGQIYAGWQSQRIAKKRSFRRLFCLIPLILFFIQFALFVAQKSAANAFEAFKFSQINGQKWKWKFDGRLESYFAIGNCFLMCFVLFSNLAALRIIFGRIGAHFDQKRHSSSCPIV